MVSLERIKKIYLLQDLSDEQLEKMLPLVEAKSFLERDTVFDHLQPARNFYMLEKGMILLRVDVNPTVTISLGSIKPGYSFGWSSLVGGAYTSHAVAAEDAEVLMIEGDQFRQLLEQDPQLGFTIMKGVVRILENRLKRRTEQLIKVMGKQMEIWELW